MPHPQLLKLKLDAVNDQNIVLATSTIEVLQTRVALPSISPSSAHKRAGTAWELRQLFQNVSPLQGDGATTAQ